MKKISPIMRKKIKKRKYRLKRIRKRNRLELKIIYYFT